MGRASIDMMDTLRQKQLNDTLPKNRSLRMSGLKAAIKKGGIKQHQFADAVGYHPTQISSIATGREGVPLRVAEYFAERLETPLSELISDNDIRQYLSPVTHSKGNGSGRRGSRPKGEFTPVDAPAMVDAIRDVCGDYKTRKSIAAKMGVSEKTIGRIFRADRNNTPIRFRREIVESIASGTGLDPEDFIVRNTTTPVIEDDSGVTPEEAPAPVEAETPFEDDTQVETIFQALDRIESKVDHLVEILGIDDEYLAIVYDKDEPEEEVEAEPSTPIGFWDRIIGARK